MSADHLSKQIIKNQYYLFIEYLIQQYIMFQRTYRLLLLLIMLISIVFTAEDEPYKIYFVSQDRGAACLDGSAPAIYIHEGSQTNKQNYLVYFKGGGFCGQSTLSNTIQSCYNRSFTNLGTSKNLSETFNTTGRGLLSTLSSQNPIFYDWTKIYINYCDGHQYAGYRQNPIVYKDKPIYFRGSRNVKQIFNYLDQMYDFYNGGKIILTGGSAGGICTFQWSNYLFQKSKKAKVLAVPDSGFFITDFYSPIVGKKRLRQQALPLMNLVFNQTEMPQPILQCLQQPEFDIVDCFNAANYAKHLKAPVFMIQSPYDSWSLKYILGVTCLSERAPFSLQNCNDTVRKIIEDYRLESISYMKRMKQVNKNIGVWGPACSQHQFQHVPSYNNMNYQVNETTLMEALRRFVEQPDSPEWLLDERPWPQNKGCSGLTSLRFDLLTQ